MKTKPWAIGLVVLATLFTTLGQYFWKIATESTEITYIILNPWLWLGFVFYGTSALLLIVALKGGDLSVLYPLIATSFIWVTLVSFHIFNEHVGINKWIGIATIIVGITYIGVGSR